MTIFRRLFIHSPIRYIVSLVIGIAVSISVLAFYGWDKKIYYCDAFFASGAILVSIGALAFVSYYGGFDIFGYVFTSLRTNRRYHDLYEYVNAKNEKRKKPYFPFMPYLMVGIVFIIASLFFLV